MDELGIKFKNIILQDMYRSPYKKRIGKDILVPEGYRLLDIQLRDYKKQLVMEGLVTEENPSDLDSFIEITPEGYMAIQTFGDYKSYIADQRKGLKLQRENEIMKSRYLKLKTIGIVITTLFTILSFIAGVLLSNQVQEMLSQ